MSPCGSRNGMPTCTARTSVTTTNAPTTPQMGASQRRSERTVSEGAATASVLSDNSDVATHAA